MAKRGKVGEVGMMHNVPVQSLIDHIKTAIDVDPWAKDIVERLLIEHEMLIECIKGKCGVCPHCKNCDVDENGLLKEQEVVVHPEPSCEMTYITDCCCDLCGVQLIHEDNFCRCCGKRIEWEGR